MKLWIPVFLMILLYSCQGRQDSSENDKRLLCDTFSVVHTRCHLFDEKPETFEYTLIRERKGDSLLSFSYYLDTALSKQYDFQIDQGRLQLIQDTTDNEHLVLVDTFSFRLLGEQLAVYKYEKFFPPVDGDVGYLFNEKYGVLGNSAYSWGIKTVMTNWNRTDFEREITGILLADSVRYLKRQEIILPPPPGQLEKIKIVEETLEIELENDFD